MGLSGVQRIAKFVKYLPQFGWEPTVLTVEPGGYFAFDTSLEQDVLSESIQIVRTQSLDPTRLFRTKSTVSLPKESSRKWLSRISQALFVPDNKIGWIHPAVQKGNELHCNRPFDAILATIPPYSSALVAYQISQKTGVPYILDYRDDWLDNPRHEYLTPIHKMAHKHFEKKVLSKCKTVISINEPIAQRIRGRIMSYFNDKPISEVKIITQGFDREDFTDKQVITNAGIFQVVYSGVFYDAQTPDYFLRALKRFLEANPESRSKVQAVFVGLIPEASKELIKELDLTDVVRHKGYLSHAETVSYLLRADVLWFTIGDGKGQELISTSKLYEYMGTEKPILGLVPDGAAKQALESYNAGWIVSPHDVDAIEEAFEKMYIAWTKGALPVPAAGFPNGIERKYLTGKLAGILDTSSSF